MIQRIQSIYLLGSALIAGVLFIVPISEFPLITSEGTGAMATINILESTGPSQTATFQYPLLILNLLILSASVFAIFLYKNRSAQIRLTTLTSLFSISLLVIAFFATDRLCPEGEKPHYLSGVYLMALQTFLLLLARRAIRKDEQLIRSADRIR